jgi:hypothetical protein
MYLLHTSISSLSFGVPVNKEEITRVVNKAILDSARQFGPVRKG